MFEGRTGVDGAKLELGLVAIWAKRQDPKYD